MHRCLSSKSVLSKAGANAVLSAYRLILRSLRRGCTGMDLAKSTNIRGNIVDGTFSTVKNEQVRDSVLDRLPKISIGFMDPNWKDMVKSEFKRSAVLDHASGKSAAKERRKLARDYAELLTEIGQHERLLINLFQRRRKRILLRL